MSNRLISAAVASAFAAAIGADQPIAIAATKFDGDVFKQRFGTKLHGDIGGYKHRARS